MSSPADLEKIVSRLEKVTSRLESLSNKGPSGETSADMPSNAATHPAVVEFDSIVTHEVKQFSLLSNSIGGDLTKLGDLVHSAFQIQRDFILAALTAAKPSNPSDLNQFLQPTSNKINEIVKYREERRTSPLFNHLSAISESIGALGWVVQEPTPGPYVKEMLAASMFYSNRVLKDHKDGDQKHKEWVQSWTAVLNRLQEYIKAYHTTGLSWSAAGVSTSKPAAPGGVPPPPPPPPPMDTSNSSSTSKQDNTTQRAALMDALNSGETVTKGLRKVTADMQTHKNPSLKKSPPPTAPKPNVSNGKVVAAAKPSHTAADKPPKLELVGNKWVVEHHKKNRDLVISDTELKQTVYIFKCDECTVQIKGKVNSIVLDNCRKTGVVFDDLISALDIVNCQSVQVQVTGQLPTVNIDKTDGCQVYLSEISKNAEIVTAKSSEMNILIPKGNGDFAEYAVPEQFRTRFAGNGLKTECSDIVG